MLISYMREDGEELCQDGNYLEHPLLQRGLLWGVARLSACRSELVLERGAGPELLPYLCSEDANTRALACIAAGHLRLKAAGAHLSHLISDNTQVTLYMQGTFATCSVAELASKALKKINDAV